ncbi:hypothetical protein [Flavobacterium sp. ACN6]|uniref:hypothetical protein n=1 Tax=Flavobacterium sp. ACN6 TaxID=1920426 RepID=UPI001141CBFD|nr:hypothetical protein [Flavobacterium sp. ACN6]PBJ13759.1 hypothetical protein BSF42_12360 [Flavobacterium sp. ACN6]
MKKLNFKVIIMQVLGLILLIHGILQLRFYTVAEKFICAVNHFQDKSSECWNRLFPAKEDIFNFWPSIYIWIFLGFLSGIILVSFLNWKNKLSPLNTILAAIVMYIIMRFKFFRKGILSRLFDSFLSVFSDDFKLQFIIGGVLSALIGILILWLSVKPVFFNPKEEENPD